MAAEIVRLRPEIRVQARAGCSFHVRAARWAVADGGADGARWPLARSVVFTAAGYPPSGWDGAALPHSAAVAAAPSAGFLYCVADKAIMHLWEAMLADEPRAMARQAPASDPGQVAEAAREAGMDGPWSVQVMTCAQWWSDVEAREVVAGYAALLPAGSTLVLSVTVPGGAGSPGELGRLAAGTAGAEPYQHSEEAITGWIAAAGLQLHPAGVTDVRALPGRRWPGLALGERLAGHVVGAVALRS